MMIEDARGRDRDGDRGRGRGLGCINDGRGECLFTPFVIYAEHERV